MASSAAIMAKIRRKVALQNELIRARTEVKSWGKTTSCLANTFSKAGALLTDSVSVGGSPVDSGRTSEMGQGFNSLTSDIEMLEGDISARISELGDEISALWGEYWAAVARERERALKAGLK